MRYKPELNFITEFKLSRNGMLLELEKEFDIIRLALTQMNELGTDYKDMLDCIAVMPLRKVLFENQHTSLILELCSDFKMPVTSGKSFEVDDKLYFELAPYSFGKMENWISLDEWKNQKIAYFDKDVSDIPDVIPDTTFQLILNKLKTKQEKTEFQQLFSSVEIEYKGEQIIGRERVEPENTLANHKIFELMKKAGYYDLTVYDFIKHLSDKRGAHIDMEIAPLIKVVNGDKSQIFTPIVCFGLQLIYAAKMQIPELKNYWPEMIDIVEKIELE